MRTCTYDGKPLKFEQSKTHTRYVSAPRVGWTCSWISVADSWPMAGQYVRMVV